ncbi:MAG: hypothetical protein ACI8XO_004168 [Verrucomicrobiales bacterium]|jgi:hypothetical protein
MTTKISTTKWLATAAMTLMFAGTASATSEGWLTDLEAAKKQAAEKDLDIFMNFTGSDW